MAIISNNFNTTDLNSFKENFDDFPIALKRHIKNIIEEEGYIKQRVETKTIPMTSNFLGTLHEVDIIGETTDGEKVTSLFIKKSRILEKITLSTVSEIYSRELFVYNDLSKIFATLQKEANVPENERFALLRSYNSDVEAIIMENLTKKGFKVYNKTEALPYRFVELSIIELAKFHALVYVIKKKSPEYFNDKIKAIKCAYNINSDWEGFIHNVCAAAHQVAQGDVKAKIRVYAPKLLELFKKYIVDSEPTNGCLCHGDYKFHNIMVKEMDGEVSSVQPIDYQLVHYGTPVNDFLFFIFSSTDQEFRRKHLRHLKDQYFENFTKFLSYFDVDVNSVYSRQEFEDDYEERLELGLVFGLIMSVFTFALDGKCNDLTKLSLSELQIVPDVLFAERINGILEDYVDWGYL